MSYGYVELTAFSSESNPYNIGALFGWTYANSTYPYQTPQNMALDQDFHCWLTDWSIKIGIKVQKPLKRKWTGPIDKNGKFHSA